MFIAAFKVIKSWLPEEAIEKIKFVTKKDLSTVVPPEEILKYWGGNNPYVFTFIPEEIEKPVVESNNTTIKKVCSAITMYCCKLFCNMLNS